MGLDSPGMYASLLSLLSKAPTTIKLKCKRKKVTLLDRSIASRDGDLLSLSKQRALFFEALTAS